MGKQSASQDDYLDDGLIMLAVFGDERRWLFEDKIETTTSFRNHLDVYARKIAKSRSLRQWSGSKRAGAYYNGGDGNFLAETFRMDQGPQLRTCPISLE